MKRSELIFNLISLPVDTVMLLFAGVASFYIRLHSTDFVGPVLYQLQVGELLAIAYRVIPLLLVIFAFLGLYNLKGTRGFSRELGAIIQGVSAGLFFVIILFFFNQTIFPSRFIILAAWGLGIAFVVLGRVILKFIQQLLFSKGYGLHRVVVINGDHQESKIIERSLKNPDYGYHLISEIDYTEATVSELEKLYYTQTFDEIIQANPRLSDQQNVGLVEFAKNKGLQFSFVPNLFDVQRNVVEIHSFKGIPVISLKNTPLDGWGKVAKRSMDIIASFICLLITAPIFITIAIAIRLDSPGKVIYAALRGGRGRDFRFYKFRSMYTHLSVGSEYGGHDAETVRQELWKKNDRGGADGPFLKIKQDPRVTRIGRFIRKTKLDEIPQFWNVLKGDMSMVGPRAHVLDEVDRYRNSYRRMFSIKPGIFGMSQIAQISWPDLPFEEEIRLNTYYIENWSLWLDVKILAKSFYLLFLAKKPKEDY